MPKRYSTTAVGPEFKQKNSKGNSYKTIEGNRKADSGGGEETHATGKRMTKGMKNSGTGLPNGPGPKPFMEKAGSGKNSGFKTFSDRGSADSGGSDVLHKATIDAWCQGKKGSYK